VGKARKELLEKLSIKTVGDMLLHIPNRFLDRRTVTPVSGLHRGQEAVVCGTILSVSRHRGNRGPSVTALLSDETGTISLTFFRQGFPASSLKSGIRVTACGTVEAWRGFNMVHPDIYFSDEAADALEAPGMLPVYRLTAGLNQGVMRRLAKSVLESVRNSLEDILPRDVLGEAGFASRWEMFRAGHIPGSPEEAVAARNCIALEELYLHRSILEAVRTRGTSVPGIPIRGLSPEDFQKHLPWPLTDAQKRVCSEISADLASGKPMRRLVQGDVGSGKTVVAAFSCAAAAVCGRTAAVLAPTEVLACQHFSSMKSFCFPMGINVHLLTGGSTASSRAELLADLTADPDAVLVGTHAVLEEWVPLDSLALLVIDEQHRFGVAQREKLLSSSNPRPHALVMSATPIPRTLAMTFYGDLDLSVLDSMPPGRGTTSTRIVTSDEKGSVFSFMLKRLECGERVFLVYPLKEVSENSDLRDASTAYDIVRNGPMARFGVGLLHGSMPAREKMGVTGRFAEGKIGVLVSTTVIEVGIDVPEATVMVIVNAERFGLSQLHQLRGRVGRGGRDSWCFLVPGENASAESMERLQVLASTSDGFEVAEKDLKSRGPGQVLGTAQHGIPEFRVADIAVDGHLISRVNSMASIDITGINSILESQLWRYDGMELPGV